MIKVLIKYQSDKFQSLEVSGHANSDIYGKDLVCAAVSAVTVGGLNAIQNINSFDVTVKEGLVTIKAKKEISNHDEIVIETIITGLKTIAEDNKDFVKIMK